MDITTDKPIRIKWESADVPVKKDETKKEKNIKRAEGYE